MGLIEMPPHMQAQLEAYQADAAAVAKAEEYAAVEHARMVRDRIADGMIAAGIAGEAIAAQRALDPSIPTPMVDALGPNVVNSPRR